MGTLMNHDNMTPTSQGNKVMPTVSSNKVSSASKHHHEDVASGGLNQAKAGMGSDRLPQGKLDTSRTV